MKVRVTLEIDARALKGLRVRDGVPKAGRQYVREEIIAVWTAHLDDLRDCAEGVQRCE
jgi:hypothetical protein